jgi:hypothetical protein
MPTTSNGPYWRQRAAEVRNMADTFTDATVKRTMLGIAERYDLLAHSGGVELSAAAAEVTKTEV